MHISITNPKPTETKLDIKADAAELAKAKDIVIKKLAPQIKAPGFRAGKVPKQIIEKNIDSDRLQSEVLEEAINRLYASALRQEQLRPVSNPEVAITKFVPFTDLEFTATIPTIGKIELADYKKIKLKRPEVKIDTKDVDDVVKSLQERAAARKDVNRASMDGDQVVINFEGTDTKGNPVQGAEGKDFPVILGSNNFIPGFEENIKGLKAGDKKTFDLTFPKDYGVSALQNKKVTFDVAVNGVQEVIKPKIDDEFAKSVGPFKDMTELRADIKKQLQIERSREAEAKYENELLEKIAAKSIIETPEMLVDEQVERIEQEEKQNLLYKGITFEEHLKEEGVTAEEHKNQKRPAAEQRVKIGVILSEVAANEKVSVTPEEVEARLQMLKAQYKDPGAQSELAKPEALRDINTRLVTEKTLNILKEYAGA